MLLISKPLLSKPKVNMLQLRQWFATANGQRLLGCERHMVQQQFARCFGSYALFYNALDDDPYVSHIRHQIKIGHAELSPDAHCTERHWPIQPGSIDIVVLQHSLEFARSAHDVLREAAQAVRPGGHILITGVSPYSTFALGRWLSKSPWRQSHCLSARRVSEWLAVLGFHIEECQFSGYRPLRFLHDADSTSFIERFMHKKQWPVGNCYMLVARKMMQGSSLQPKRKATFEKLMPLPAASASRSGTLEKNKHND